MKKLRSCLAFGAALLLMSGLLLPVAANSAQSYWKGTDATGAIVTDNDCPIVVEHELLTFDVQDFPEPHYTSAEAFLAYPGKVTAEYSFYNPADYSVTATLRFPFGVLPDYAVTYDESKQKRCDDTVKYEISVNGEVIEKTLRHSSHPQFSGQFDLYTDMGKLYDSYIEDEFYHPDLPVTKFTFLASGVDEERYPAADGALYLTSDETKTKVLMENLGGGDGTNEDYSIIKTWVDEEKPFSVYVMGEVPQDFPQWKFYSDGSGETEIEGRMELLSSETMTMKDLALLKMEADSPVLEHDWYNAVIAMLKNREWSHGAIDCDAMHELNVSYDLMRWYEYEITLAPGERLVNTVTAPIYPDVNTGYKPPVYSYGYLLSPAKTWADFGTLDVVINTDSKIYKSEPRGYEKDGSSYKLSLDGLPDGELTFSLCNKRNPSRTSSYGSGFLKFVLVVIAGFVGLAYLFMHFANRRGR